jgi:hypothetical protein
MIEFVALGLAVASLILSVVAPRTKTKLDDKAKEVVDAASALIPLAKAAEPMGRRGSDAPPAPPPPATTSAPGGVMTTPRK